jgi:hypothetical protein
MASDVRELDHLPSRNPGRETGRTEKCASPINETSLGSERYSGQLTVVQIGRLYTVDAAMADCQRASQPQHAL